MDLIAIFTTPEAWISLFTLIFLEIVLGIDNLVFIAITTNRLPPEKQHIGRKLGLAGAMLMRCLFLCFASFLVHMTSALFTIDLGFWSHGFSVRDLVLLVGGAYLIYKGISEVRDTLALTEVKADHSEEHKALHQIGLPQAVATIMVMDIVFSIDSVITAVGLANHLIIMILAVITAVLLMMVFIDFISDFINSHPEMKILALCFIAVIGVLLFLDSLGINSGIEIFDMYMEKLMVYFAMMFAFVLELVQMAYNNNLASWKQSRWNEQASEHIESLRDEAISRAKAAADADANAKVSKSSACATPVFIDDTAYVLIPIPDEEAEAFRTQANDPASATFDTPINLGDASKTADVDAADSAGKKNPSE